jgi:hypothetical protein
MFKHEITNVAAANEIVNTLDGRGSGRKPTFKLFETTSPSLKKR